MGEPQQAAPRGGEGGEGPWPPYLICRTSRSTVTEQRKGFQFLPEIGEGGRDEDPGKVLRVPSPRRSGCAVPPSSLPPGLLGVTCTLSGSYLGLSFLQP